MSRSSLSSLAQRTHARWSTLYTSLRLIALASLLTLSTSTALAQTYTYQTIDVPWAINAVTTISAITDMGKLAGVWSASDIGPSGSWTWLNAKSGYQKVSFKDKLMFIHDMNGSNRSVGLYYPTKNRIPTGPEKAFTINSGTLTTLKLPPLVRVDSCSINEFHDIVCTGWTEQDIIQAVRVKGSTAGVLQVYTPGVFIFGINGARDVVGTQWDQTTSTYRGYYRHADTGQITLIDAPCGLDTVIMDVNLVSTLAAVQCGNWEGGGFDYSESVPRSYAFNGVTWTELNLPGSPYTLVHRVNNAGQLAGYYQDPDPMFDEVMHGFIATPVFGQPIAQR